jgi:lipopolysaccharide transport system ATP-binding protein
MSTAISIKNVSKKYVIGKQKDGSLRGTLAGMFSRGKAKTEEFLALNDVSFDIQQGDVVGIIGKNGAGKSTLLKILSQITKPSAGSIEINGRVASLLEVGTGFHPELTGRENVYLNGTILGMTRKEVKAKFDEIVAFSGVEKFIDTPVKHYSSGMYVRLAFAVAAHLEPEILIIDEVLAVGDAEFQKKCLGKMGEVAGEGRTVIFVSHDLSSIINLCKKGILLNSGCVIEKGEISNVVSAYTNRDLSTLYLSKHRNKACFTKSISMHSESFDRNNFSFLSDEKIILKVELHSSLNSSLLQFGIAIKDTKGNKLTTIIKTNIQGINTHYLSISPNTFFSGDYLMDVSLFEKKGKIYEYLNDCISFKVIDEKSELSMYKSNDIGAIRINYDWSV